MSRRSRSRASAHTAFQTAHIPAYGVEVNRGRGELNPVEVGAKSEGVRHRVRMRTVAAHRTSGTLRVTFGSHHGSLETLSDSVVPRQRNSGRRRKYVARSAGGQATRRCCFSDIDSARSTDAARTRRESHNSDVRAVLLDRRTTFRSGGMPYDTSTTG